MYQNEFWMHMLGSGDGLLDFGGELITAHAHQWAVPALTFPYNITFIISLCLSLSLLSLSLLSLFLLFLFFSSLLSINIPLSYLFILSLSK